MIGFAGCSPARLRREQAHRAPVTQLTDRRATCGDDQLRYHESTVGLPSVELGPPGEKEAP
jgi:hypothetical protein